MKKIKGNRIAFTRRVLSFLLIVLGFSGCGSDNEETYVSMYDMPPTVYKIKTHVHDQDNAPLEGIKVEVKPEGYNQVLVSGSTNSTGVYEVGMTRGKYNIVCTDISEGDIGVFGKDSIQVEISEAPVECDILLKVKE